MYLPYISQYFLAKYTVSTRKYCTVKGSVTGWPSHVTTFNMSQ